MHYTSVENIHKVIDPLFMDELEGEFETIQTYKTCLLYTSHSLTTYFTPIAKIKIFGRLDKNYLRKWKKMCLTQ